MTDREKNIRILVFLVLILLVMIGASVVKAATNKTENQSGKAYGSAVNKDTAYVTWDSKSYIDLEPYKTGIDINMKVLVAASDTVIFRFLGSNAKPDTLHYYDLIFADTINMSSPGDSIMHVTFPFGTSSPTTVLPKYMKIELFLYDADAGGAATATISDSWMAR